MDWVRWPEDCALGSRRRVSARLPAVARPKTRQNGRQVQAKRGELKLCGAAKSSGEPCTQPAGFGTDHPGQGRCRWHPKGQGLAATANAAAEAGGLGGPVHTSPGKAIMGVLAIATGHLIYASSKVAELESTEVWSEEGSLNKWIRWQERLSDRVAKYAATAVGMNVAERQGDLVEAQTRMVTGLLENVIRDLDLTPAQRKKLGPSIRKHTETIEQAEL